MKRFVTAASAATLITLLCACSEPAPSTSALRPVSTIALHYDSLRNSHRYFASVASRYEVEQTFRIGGKVQERKVDVGQVVNEGDVLYRLERAGFVDVRWETPQRGVPRKYYRLTKAGREELATLTEEWTNFTKAMTKLLQKERKTR